MKTFITAAFLIIASPPVMAASLDQPAPAGKGYAEHDRKILDKLVGQEAAEKARQCAQLAHLQQEHKVLRQELQKELAKALVLLNTAAPFYGVVSYMQAQQLLILLQNDESNLSAMSGWMQCSTH